MFSHFRTIRWMVGLAVLALLAGAAPALAQDTVTFPLTGAYAVGRNIYTWTDESREEVYTPDVGDKRQLQVWAWYPAQSAASPAPYLSDGQAALLGQMFAIPADKVQTHAAADASLSDAQPAYPVIVFSHGNGSNAAFYASLLEELASYGYIVFGVDHTWNTLLTTTPDGQVVPGLPDAQDQSPDDFEVRVADIVFVLDQLEVVNTQDDTFAGKLDLEHIGLAGHSFGGATAAEACRRDVRCDAALVMDSPLQGEVSVSGLSQPVLLMDAQHLTCDALIEEMEAILNSPAPDGFAEVCAAMVAAREAGNQAALNNSVAAYHLSIDGSRHGNFGDIGYLLGLQPMLQAQLGGFATITAGRASRIINDYTLAFFDTVLKGQPSTLLDAPSPDYPEVIFEG
jgi:pimeloyl-ACP methyl ester carboxylesterase